MVRVTAENERFQYLDFCNQRRKNIIMFGFVFISFNFYSIKSVFVMYVVLQNTKLYSLGKKMIQ